MDEGAWPSFIGRIVEEHASHRRGASQTIHEIDDVILICFVDLKDLKTASADSSFCHLRAVEEGLTKMGSH